MIATVQTVAERNWEVLTALAAKNLTCDEFVVVRGVYVNSWAPVFTKLRKAGLIRWTGERRPTAHGDTAHVCEITPAGRALLS